MFSLQEFLFGKENISVNRGSSPSFEEMEKKIQNLQNQVNYLQDKISDLESTLKNSKHPLRLLTPSKSFSRVIYPQIKRKA